MCVYSLARDPCYDSIAANWYTIELAQIQFRFRGEVFDSRQIISSMGLQARLSL